VLANANAKWTDHASQSWRFEHVRKCWLKNQLAQAKDRTTQAVFAEQLERSEASLQGLRALADAQPENAQLQFELGLALIHRKSESGATHVRAAIKIDRRLGVKGQRALLEALGTDARREDVEAAGRRLNAAIHRQRVAMDGLWRRIALDGNFWALPRHSADLLAAACGADAFLDGCWALQTQCIAGETVWPVTLFIPRVEYGRLQEFGVTEDELRQRYAYLVDAISPPEQAILVQVILTTEPFYPRLLEKLQGMAGTCLVEPRTKINEGVHRVDSL
jgi:hypothetical protein